MSLEADNADAPSSRPSRDEDQSLTSTFFDGLPLMAAIVTMIAQPFAQDSLHKTLGLPGWLPFVVAMIVSGLLAVYKVAILRRSAQRDCLVCIPLLMLIIFSAYATGNNVVYYAKEGYTKSDTGTAMSDEITALRKERDNLQEQLANANGVISTLQQTLNPSGTNPGKPRTALPSILGLLMLPREASAQGGPSRPTDLAAPTGTHQPVPLDAEQRRRLQEALRQYETRQQALDQKLEQIKRESPPSGTQRLIKSW